MEKTKPDIDTAKLRRLMRERNQAYDHSRHLTDHFLEIRDEIARFEGAINKPGRHIDKVSRNLELARLQAIREEADQLQSDRDSTDLAIASYACVAGLVNYARGIGLVIDEQRCTVRRPHTGEPMRVSA